MAPEGASKLLIRECSARWCRRIPVASFTRHPKTCEAALPQIRRTCPMVPLSRRSGATCGSAASLSFLIVLLIGRVIVDHFHTSGRRCALQVCASACRRRHAELHRLPCGASETLAQLSCPAGRGVDRSISLAFGGPSYRACGAVGAPAASLDWWFRARTSRDRVVNPWGRGLLAHSDLAHSRTHTQLLGRYTYRAVGIRIARKGCFLNRLPIHSLDCRGGAKFWQCQVRGARFCGSELSTQVRIRG